MALLIFASAAVKEVLGKLASLAWEELELLWNFKEDLEDMDHTLSTLQAVLQDAEMRYVKDEALRLWLDHLKDAAYDMEDTMNKFLVEISQHGRQDGLLNKVRDFLSKPFRTNVTMAHKMKNMRERLNRIAEKRSKFHLKEDTSLDKQEIVKKRETFSEIDESQVYGRDKEKETIIDFLLDENCKEDVSVFSIVGIGGLGKTTLAKFVYNNKRVLKKRFDVRAWVYVSMEFDLKKIARDLISVTGGEGNFRNLESARDCLREILLEKRYLIVLDDIWEEDMKSLDELKHMLRGGARGSKIMVTTRSHKVAKLMGTTEPHHLKPLSEEDCWMLFRQRAFVSADEEHKYKNLVKIGKEIAKKCGGVALAANALGNMMCFDKRETFWIALRDGKTWGLHKGENLSENVILSSLKLSYCYMPFQLKLCFSYCSIFPKGYEIDKDKLIQQWIALGFVKAAQQNMSQLVDIGQKYIDDLRGMSFLQDFEEHEKTRRVTCTMHDLVHDLAQLVGGSEIITNDSQEAYKDAKSPLYIAVVGYEGSSKIYAAASTKVRALHFKNWGFQKYPKQLFSQIENVRVLDISQCSIDELPTFISKLISKLKQLRYLDASRLPLHTLPELTCDHPNLQMLDLSGTFLLETTSKTIDRLHGLHFLNLSKCSNLLMLHDLIEKLQCLQHLDLSSCSNLKSLPSSIGNLQCLQHLDLSSCSNIKSLPSSIGKLQCLQHLDLSECHKLQSIHESIGKLQCLQHLDLSRCYKLQSLPDSISDLQRLQYLGISECGKLKSLFESNGNLQRLQYLDLSECSELESLPESLGNLQSLQHFDLSECGELKLLPKSISNLQSLQHLNLSSCYNLKSLPDSIEKLQCLQHLDLSDCHKLQSIPESFGKLQCLLHLDLSRCELKLLPESISNLQRLQHLGLSKCGKLKSLPKFIGNLQRLQHLDLSKCGELKSLPKSIGNLQSLQHLDLSECNALDFLPKSISNLRSLQHLDLSRCGELKSLPESIGDLQILQYLDLKCCSKLESLPESIGNIPSLQHLGLYECCALKSLFESIGNLQNLKQLDLSRCGELKSLPKSIGRLQTLQYLDLGWCGELESLPKSIGNIQTLQHLSLSNCLQLHRLPEDIGSLVNLLYLDLSWCKALRTLPPSLCNLIHLEKLNLTECYQVPDLPSGLVTISSLLLVDRNGGKIPMGIDRLKLKLSVVEDGCGNPISTGELQYVTPSSVGLEIGGLTLSPGRILHDWRWSWEEVVERLLPPSDLRFLELDGYLGHKFPSWMMDGIHLRLPNLVEIEFDGIDKCDQLPPLGQLLHLKKLKLSRMDAIRNIGGEFYGGSQIAVAFPSLEDLYLYDMFKLEAWETTMLSGDDETRQVAMLPCLNSLEIVRCPNLRLRPFIPSSVVRLHLHGSDKVLSSWDLMGPSSSSSSVERQQLEFHSRLEELDVICCMQLTGLPLLEELDIICCMQLTGLPRGMRHLRCLRALRILECSNLSALPQWLGELTSLRELEIRGMEDCSLPQCLQQLIASGKVSLWRS